MSNQNDILRRKAETAKEDREARLISPRRALRRALTRAAELGLGLPLAVKAVQESTLDRDRLFQQMEPGGLLVSLDRDDAPPGLIVLDLQLLSALIEVQTLGQVFEAQARERRVTRTDAAVAMPLIDGMLNAFDQLMAGQDRSEPLSGYHFGSWIRDLRMLQASLPDGQYTLFDVSVVLGAGPRVGNLLLALPVLPEPEVERPEAGSPRGSIREEVLDAPARLETVLHQLDMTVTEIGALKPGDILSLPQACLNAVRLHAGDRQTIAIGTLGQLNGNRAVRLSRIGQARVAAAPSSPGQLPNMKTVDLADAGLVTPVRPAKKEREAPLPPADIAPPKQVPSALGPETAMSADNMSGAELRDDPTGTEALLTELGLSDLGGADAGLSLGALEPSEKEPPFEGGPI